MLMALIRARPYISPCIIPNVYQSEFSVTFPKPESGTLTPRAQEMLFAGHEMLVLLIDSVPVFSLGFMVGEMVHHCDPCLQPAHNQLLAEHEINKALQTDKTVRSGAALAASSCFSCHGVPWAADSPQHDSFWHSTSLRAVPDSISLLLMLTDLPLEVKARLRAIRVIVICSKVDVVALPSLPASGDLLESGGGSWHAAM